MNNTISAISNFFQPSLEVSPRNKILFLDFDIVKGNLLNAVFALQRGENVKPSMGVKSIYFIGSTLCMDIGEDVLTFKHRDETIGFFSGGFRLLLSIENMRLLEAIMDMCEIVHTQKWVTKRTVQS